MTTFGLSSPLIGDEQQQRNNEDLLGAVNTLGQFLYYGSGVPAFTPTGRAIYIDVAGGAGTTLYVWEGAAWVGK